MEGGPCDTAALTFCTLSPCPFLLAGLACRRACHFPRGMTHGHRNELSVSLDLVVSPLAGQAILSKSLRGSMPLLLAQ